MAATRTALALRPERRRGRNCRKAGMEKCSYRGPQMGASWEILRPYRYVPRPAGGECDIQHKIAFFSALVPDIGGAGLTRPPAPRGLPGENRRKIHSGRA